MGFKDIVKGVWHFLWDEDSIWSWIANVVLAFVIIKFLLYPGLGFALGTPAPIVAVVSGSMEHDGNFEEFWTQPSCCSESCGRQLIQGDFYERQGVSSDLFRSFDFVNGFNMGDIMILYSPESIDVGDVAVFMTNTRPDPIIHRVIGVSEKNNQEYITTKGDHNCDMGQFEKEVPKSQVIGKAIWRVPLLGWVKIFAVWFLQGLQGLF